MIIFVLGGWLAEPAVEFLDSQRRRLHKRAIPSRAAFPAMLHDWILATCAKELDSLVYPPPENTARLKQVQVAETFLADFRLKEWVKHQNVDKGLAPSTKQLWEQRFAAAASRTQETEPVVAHKNFKQWGHKWRKKWGARIGKPRQHEVKPPEHLLRKVSRNIILGKKMDGKTAFL